MLINSRSRLSRKYVDLIFAYEGKYGSWEPSNSVKLGDYGYLDKDSGAFNVQGNIFKGDFAKRHSDVLSAVGEPIVLPPDDYRVIVTADVKQQNNMGINLSAPTDSVNISMKWHFTFGQKHGAALVMIKPVVTKFPLEGNIKPLLQLIGTELNAKVLVTAIVTCPSYGQIISCGRDNSASISMTRPGAPLPSLPLGAGAEGETSLQYESTAGVWKAGSEDGCTYTPLFELSILKSWWGGNSKPATLRGPLRLANPTPFAPYVPPWRPLDEDGEEME